MTFIEDKIRDARLRYLGHIRRRGMDTPMKRCEMLDRPNHKRSRVRSKKSGTKLFDTIERR